MNYFDINSIENSQVLPYATPSEYEDTEEEITDYDYDGQYEWENSYE